MMPSLNVGAWRARGSETSLSRFRPVALALMAQADTQGISLRAQSSFGALGKLGDLLYWRSCLGMRTQFFLFGLRVFTADALLNFLRHEALLF